MIKVSIVITVYRAESFLSRCLDSIISQSMPDWEVIMVDDGSPDLSGQICDEYVRKDGRFKCIHQSNKGVSAARQTGLSVCTGEYVIHIDSDDWIDTDMIQSLYENAVSSCSDMVICDFIEEWKWGSVIRRQKPSSLDPEVILREMYERLHGSCCNKLVRRSLFDQYNISFPEGMNFCEDLYVNTALLMHPIVVNYLPKAFYHYDHTSNPTSIVNDASRVSNRAVIMVNGLSKLLKDRFPDILDKIKVQAKRTFISGGYSYNSFLSVYSEVNQNISLIEKSCQMDSSVSFACKNRVNFYLVKGLFKFKDYAYVIRKYIGI